MVYRWRRQLEAEGVRAFPGNDNPRDAELARLRKQVRELREEQDILRKTAAIFLENAPMKHRFIAAHQESHSVGKMADLLNVSRSGYYAWQATEESARVRRDRALIGQIGQIQKEVRHVYGSPA